MRTRVLPFLRAYVLACALTAACGDAPNDPDTTPPGPIASLTATVSGATVRLTWREPADPDVSGSLVVRFGATGANASPDAGRTYVVGGALGAGQVVFAGRGTQA